MEDKKQNTESRRCEIYEKHEYKKSSYKETYEMLQSLRQDEFLCDIKLETDDDTIIIAHKVVLASASPYFYAMFTKFSERNHELVVMREIGSTALQLLVNYIYSGEIMVTEEIVQELLPAADLLQLEEVKEACCDFLQSQLCPTNCIDIYSKADIYSCMKLLTSSELYIQQHFSDVVGSDELLSLSSEQMVKLISSDKLTVPSEEKVFEGVIRWVKHELGSRKYILPQLMEHVRLPLTSKDYLLKKVVEEPLIKNSFKCKDYISEALNYHILKSDDLIPQNIRNIPRHGDKVILVVGGFEIQLSTAFFDQKMNQCHNGPKMITTRYNAGLAVVKENLVFAVGGHNRLGNRLRSVDVLDLSSESPRWKSSEGMLVERDTTAVGVINDNLYAVGGSNDDDGALDSAEVFDYNTQKWRMISSMSTRRFDHGAAVLNNLLYVVGGLNNSWEVLDTVECYDPILDTWTPVAKMSVAREGVGVGVLNGVLYAVGGEGGLTTLRSVEAYSPSTEVWTTIADMNFTRIGAGVVALDGLLYVIGGTQYGSDEDSTECYSPKTNTWTIVAALRIQKYTNARVVAINRPQHLKTFLRTSNPRFHIPLTMQNENQKTESKRFEKYAKYEYKNSSFAETYEVLQSLRQDEFLCDIKLETDDDNIIIAHKVVLASASPYFYEMFAHFSVRTNELVVMRHIDSTALQLLVNFIYSGKIVVTEENVQVLLAVANILQLQEVKEACCEYFQSQLCPTNCIDIYSKADRFSYLELISSSELYIQQHFLEVVGGDEFLSLSSKQLTKLISSDKLIVPSEDKVFENVIRWVKHDLGSRKFILPELMEHVRLPLISMDYILKKVVEEPLIKNCFKCKDYISEALHFHVFKSEYFIPQNIRNNPRHGDKVILVVGGLENKLSTAFYDQKKNRWHNGPKMITNRENAGLAVVKENLLYAVGGCDDCGKPHRSVEVLDLSSESPCWKISESMLTKRDTTAVGVINDNLYAVGGLNGEDGALDSAEVFDYNTQKWRMISRMSTRRFDHGAAVLNYHLYVVGGINNSWQCLDNVECYNPSHDKWSPVAKMSVARVGAGVGVLDGVLYAVGGRDGPTTLKSVEAYSPSTGVWSTIADMHKPRKRAGVVALEGLLYVYGRNQYGSDEDSTECYSPKTNTWTIVAPLRIHKYSNARVLAINRPQHLKTS